MNFGILLSLLFSSLSMASIIGSDDRVDTKLAGAQWQELGKSVPAFIQHQRIKALPNGQFELQGKPMTQMGLCSGELYAEEQSIANCSASFIGKNKILTAAHCLDEKTYACDTYSVVFDYQRTEIPMASAHILDQSQIYKCKKVIFTKFDPSVQGIDLAVIELDRDVVGRKPIELDFSQNLKVNDPLVMIGYPMGISQKVVESGKVLRVDKKNVSFSHDLDSFSVNSGGPIFSENGKQVGVLARGTGANIKFFSGKDCGTWGVGKEGFDYSEGNDLSPLRTLLMSENR